ncbi:MAG: 30S ribosomal protein S3 [Malacoplasma sp.]|nr:30S ribosomal protein S3 [Malacoplasma sp.]MDE5842068.1 30S ribosomal protein S3 [Malacoplasma sp.]MDE6082274.1 30S ribosomal protein S3 [Malacoplasma sp.]MDE6428983.1 30S ribosomal protein S3 [Malacoplasma sp.]MDE6563121.1 30S ribosomal protein S3 [Malacoplasma sp.]
MGQKVNPNGLRIGIIRNWESRWIAKDNKQTALWLVQDDKIRKHIFKVCKAAQVSHVEIERQQNKIDIFIHCSQPGIVLGKDMVNLKTLKKQLNYIVGRKTKVNVNVLPIDKPTFSARIIAREIADAIENRFSFRNAQKIAIKKVLASGAKGIKTNVSGRLGGVEMAREEGYSEGIVPLTTLRANIDYALEEAWTTYGLIGVKVWINRGELFKKSTSQFNKFERKPVEKRKPEIQQSKPEFKKPVEKPVEEEKPTKPVKAETLKREKEVLKVVESKTDESGKKGKVEETSIIMISTKHEYADNLLNEDLNKNVFFYKVTPVNPIERVLVYTTTGKKEVIGEFDLEKIEILPIESAWRKYGKQSCMSKADFDEYYKDYNGEAHVLISKEAFKYSRSKKLENYGMKKGPSGFQYLK